MVPNVVLIGCGAAKRKEGAWPAVDLYVGSLYRAHLRILRAAGLEPTHVLSALHGAIRAREVIRRYECRLGDAPPERALIRAGRRSRERAWGHRALAALERFVLPKRRWLVLAGAPYVDAWADLAADFGVEVLDPLRGMGTGARLSLARRVDGDGMAARVALGLEDA